MPLIDIWKANPPAVEEMGIEQIVSTAGDGRLLDGSDCSRELREFLQQIDSDDLARHTESCLSAGFSKSGLVLQDLVNELGRRLDYDVQSGLYQGRTNEIGFDGLWSSPEDRHLLVEVKTTDTYRINLETLAEYRRKVIKSTEITGDVSILLVVGRQDTGDLEAQVRGSKHAWDVRLISADALLKLVKIKESTEDPASFAKIRELLIPFEYTRIDHLIDIVFTTTRDVEVSTEVEREPGLVVDGRTDRKQFDFTDPDLINAKRDSILEALNRIHDTVLVKKTRATYWDSSHSIRVVCTISKRYPKGQTDYWYAYHPSWDEFLQGGEKSFFVLGCVDLNTGFAVPHDVLTPLLSNLNTTEREDGKMYWHVKVVEDSGEYLLLASTRDSTLSLSAFAVRLDPS